MNPRITFRWSPPWVALGLVLFVLAASVLPVAAQGQEAALEGTIYNAEGQPVPECRVVVRVAEGTDVFVSPPSDSAGRYRVAVPSGGRYLLVALVSPTGGRVALGESESLMAFAGGATQRDVQIPLPGAPSPRKAGKELGGADRLFLAFVEDPALARRKYLEVQLERADFNAADRLLLRAIAAFQFAQLPRVEIGVRGGWADIEFDGGGIDDSGAIDMELWGKFHLTRSADNRTDLAVGALLTFPTGDEQLGLGQDALQSKLFVSLGYALASAAVVGHVGVRSTESGQVAGLPLDGEISASAGLGVLVPFSPKLSLAFEANYEGERFDGSESDSNVLFGINYQAPRGKVRAALSAGLEDSSADAALLVGYAYAF